MGESETRPIAFRSGGRRLHGLLGAPARPEPRRRGVVLIHGWGGYRIGPHRLLVRTARDLRERGFATLRFDLRGRGDSEGDGPKTSLDDMIEDTLGAVRCLRDEAKPDSIVMLGICSGANVAIGAATLDPDALRELALWSALPFQPEQRARQRLRRARAQLGRYARKVLRPGTWARLLKGDVDLGGVGRSIAGDGAPRAAGPNLKDSARNLMAGLRVYRGRMLFVTGTKDAEGMEGHALFTRACRVNGLDAAFHLVDGATHSFYAPAHTDAVISQTIGWLEGRSENE